jgi:ArsR family transcriptional regulator, zinc-responsive transcriptional repressor
MAATKTASKSTKSKSSPKATKGAKTAKPKASEAGKRMADIRRAAVLLKQVSDPTRIQVVLMLDEGEKHVGAMSDALNQSQPATSHHLALLRHGGIIISRRDGKNNFYSLTELGEELAKAVKGVVS